jgi:2,3-bisphosphoglycerate-dependent phosphoglycerate mutase
MAKLILIRHGKSEWNLKGLWTGWTDIPLAPEGRQEARSTGALLKQIPIDEVFISTLKRAKETWEEVNTVLNVKNIPINEAQELNERNYGDLTGKNKWEVKEKIGEEEFQKIRRSWDYPVPNGESLKDVYNRVIPYYEQRILPRLKENKNILIAAHGNSLRALTKYLEHISDEEIPKIELPTGTAHVYTLDEDGNVTNKEVFGNTENTV